MIIALFYFTGCLISFNTALFSLKKLQKDCLIESYYWPKSEVKKTKRINFTIALMLSLFSWLLIIPVLIAHTALGLWEE